MGIERQNETVTQVLEQLRQEGKLPPAEPVSRREELAEVLMNGILTWIEKYNPTNAEAVHYGLQAEAVNILVHVLAGEMAAEELNPVWTEIINREPTEENGWKFRAALDTRQREIAGRLTEAIFQIGMQSAQAKPATKSAHPKR